MPLTSFYPWHWTSVPAEYTSISLYNTGASLTATLSDNVNYALLDNSWSPAVAGDKPDQSGGRPFNRVVESINLLVMGTTRAEALQNLNKLIRLLKLAEEWQNDMTANITTTPTIFQWEPQGSTDGPWEAMVIGRTDKTRNYLSLPVKFNEELVLYMIEGVKLEFLREGEWLGDTETTAASSAAPSGDIMSVTFVNNLDIPSPTTITLGSLGATLLSPRYSFLFLVHTSTDIRVMEGEAVASGGSNINEDANKARGTAGANVRRFTGATSYTTAAFVLASSLAHKTIGVYAVMRTSDADRTWRLYATSLDTSSVANGQTRVSTFVPGVAEPYPHFFGTIQSVNKDHLTITVYYAVDSTDGSPTLDIDYLVFIGLDNPVNRVIGIQPITNSTLQTDLVFDPRQLTGVGPRIISDDVVPFGWDRGNPYIVSTGTNLSALWMAPVDQYWRWTASGGGGTLVNLTLTASRQRAMLLPE